VAVIKRWHFLVWALLSTGTLVHAAEAPADTPAAFGYATFAEWRDACARLPSNRALQSGAPMPRQLPLKTFGELGKVVDAFCDLAIAGHLAQATNWVGAMPAKQDFFNKHRAYFDDATVPFVPFVQKLSIPAGAEVILHGDFHGDVRSLIAIIEALNQSKHLSSFKLVNPNTYVLFLGDYTDRGMYGVEVLYTLFRLKLANPDRVFMVRGNHEDISLAARYGFLAEGRSKYGAGFDGRKICRAYDFLPTAIYLGSGTNFTQCCHGGMEPGYSAATLLGAPGNNRYQLLGALNQKQLLHNQAKRFDFLDGRSKSAAERYWLDFTPLSPITPTPIGFMWNDFSQIRGEAQLEVDPGRALVFGDRLTQTLLDLAGDQTNRVRAVFRAHQHSSVPNPMMRRLVASQGLFRHWQSTDAPELMKAPESVLSQKLDRAAERTVGDSAVWTFNVSPDSHYGVGNNFDFDTYAILTVQPDFKDWRLKVMNLPMKP
jgi:hypothetical protein